MDTKHYTVSRGLLTQDTAHLVDLLHCSVTDKAHRRHLLNCLDVTDINECEYKKIYTENCACVPYLNSIIGRIVNVTELHI